MCVTGVCVCVSILFAVVNSMQIQLIEIESCDHQKWKSIWYWYSLRIIGDCHWIDVGSPRFTTLVTKDMSRVFKRRQAMLPTASCIMCSSRIVEKHMSENAGAPIIHWLIIHFPS